jgi:hypothetical protein
MPTNGPAIAMMGIGSLFLYSAVKGKSILASAQAVITGQSPQTVAQSNPIASNTPLGGNSFGGGGIPVSGGSGKSILQKTAAQYGWTGSEWSALQSIESQEDASYSPTIKNPSSGALGMAQALGHGNANTAGSLGNEYGGFGLTDAQAKQANSGDASMQALWMCNYIKQTYGNPSNAEAFHLANGWY